MRLLHNVFRVGRANLVLASDTPTTPVQADRDVTRILLYIFVAARFSLGFFRKKEGESTSHSLLIA